MAVGKSVFHAFIFKCRLETCKFSCVFFSSIELKLMGGGGGSSCYIVTLLIVFNTVFVKRMKGISLWLELTRVLMIMIFLVSDLGVG